uniref:Uncharacterized protein n=1 Tax=Arundo donax TaxID=35708 RepID=A0A0A8Z3H9_ARUDO
MNPQSGCSSNQSQGRE